MAKLKKPSFKILLYTYKNLSNGQHPVMIRVTFDRKQKYFSLGMSASKENWNDDLARLNKAGKRLTEQEKDMNILLDRFNAKLEKAKKHFEDVDFSFDRFDKFFFQAIQSNDVFKFTQEIIDELIAESRIGSALSYRDTLNRLKHFRKEKDFTFRDIDLNFLDEFKKHLRTNNSTNSIGIYLRTLKAIYNRAIRKSLINEDFSPWKGYKIETETTRKRALTRDQIEILKSYEAERGSAAWHSLNYFLFSYYCRGMNFEDVARLTPDNIRNDRIFYIRKKTGDAMDMAIDSRIAEILLSYSKSENFIFPILTPGLSALTIKYRVKTHLKNVNKELQNIVKAINKMPENKIKQISLPEDITFYWGRHSAATMLKRSGVSTAMISEILGHSSEAVTKTYLDSFEKNQLDQVGSYL